MRLTSSFPLRKMWILLQDWFQTQHNIRMILTTKGTTSFHSMLTKDQKIQNTFRFRERNRAAISDNIKGPHYVPVSDIKGI